MASFPRHGGHSENSSSNSETSQPFKMDFWTEEATRSSGIVSHSSPANIRRTVESLEIPLEEDLGSLRIHAEDDSNHRPCREPLRRDSLKRREALLKGKEGSRRRQRWENDRLLSNPWAQPPLPSDWEVHPTYTKHIVPYYLAPLWDANLAAKQTTERKRRESARQDTERKDEGHGKVPKELREKLKKAKAAKGLLKALEEEVRKFVKSWEDGIHIVDKGASPEMDSEDEEIVFVGRNGQMHDIPPSPKLRKYPDPKDVKTDQLVFDSLADDHGANFGRWLVHSIGSYYGLRTWSVTVGDPARREAYVGIKQMGAGGGLISPVALGGLPRPLWGMV